MYTRAALVDQAGETPAYPGRSLPLAVVIRSYCFLKSSYGQRIQNLAASDPSATRDSDSKLHIVQSAGRMRVDRDHELDLPFARLAQPVWLHIQTIRVTVDLDRRARFGNHIQNFFDPTIKRRTALNQTPQRMAPNLECRLPHGSGQSTCHLVFVHLVTRVNACHDHVELLENPIGIIQRAVGENIRLSAFENLDLCLLLNSLDLFPLSL